MVSLFLRFLDHTQRRTTVGRTPLDERSVHRRDLYLTRHNTHNRQTTSPVGFEPTIPGSERLQTHALDRAATGTGCVTSVPNNYSDDQITEYVMGWACGTYGGEEKYMQGIGVET